MFNVVLLDQNKMYNSEVKGEKEVFILERYKNYIPYTVDPNVLFGQMEVQIPGNQNH